MRARSLRRSLVLLGAVAALVVSVVSPAAAGTVTGQHGHYLINDLLAPPLVNCHYSNMKLDKFVAKPPQVWWSDLGSGRQQGKVGWKILVQQNNASADLTWKTVYASPLVTKTAYEDAPLYDVNDQAAFTTRGIPWSKTGNLTFRLVYKVTWFWPNGTKGRLSHPIQYYKRTGDAPGGTSEGYCFNKILL